MAFQLDTSGLVPASDVPAGVQPLALAVSWSDLSPFTQGYVEALLTTGGAGRGWSKADKHDWPEKTARHVADGSAPPLPSDIAFSDLAPETLARIIADCEAGAARWGYQVSADHQSASGARFWEERNDGMLPLFPALTALLGDDGKVRLQ